MFSPILAVAKDFGPIWNDFIDEWKEEKELPQYLALSKLARYISQLVENGKTTELENIFAVIERWHLEGDGYVKEAATVGMIEDLQNTSIVGEDIPEQLESYLLPESKKRWQAVYEFWETGKTISE